MSLPPEGFELVLVLGLAALRSRLAFWLGSLRGEVTGGGRWHAHSLLGTQDRTRGSEVQFTGAPTLADSGRNLHASCFVEMSVSSGSLAGTDRPSSSVAPANLRVEPPIFPSLDHCLLL